MTQKKYCTECNREYDYQSRPSCDQCGSTKSGTFTLDTRSEDLTRFFSNRLMKEYTRNKSK